MVDRSKYKGNVMSRQEKNRYSVGVNDAKVKIILKKIKIINRRS